MTIVRALDAAHPDEPVITGSVTRQPGRGYRKAVRLMAEDARRVARIQASYDAGAVAVPLIMQRFGVSVTMLYALAKVGGWEMRGRGSRRAG